MSPFLTNGHALIGWWMVPGKVTKINRPSITSVFEEEKKQKVWYKWGFLTPFLFHFIFFCFLYFSVIFFFLSYFSIALQYYYSVDVIDGPSLTEQLDSSLRISPLIVFASLFRWLAEMCFPVLFCEDMLCLVLYYRKCLPDI